MCLDGSTDLRETTHESSHLLLLGSGLVTSLALGTSFTLNLTLNLVLGSTSQRHSVLLSLKHDLFGIGGASEGIAHDVAVDCSDLRTNGGELLVSESVRLGSLSRADDLGEMSVRKGVRVENGPAFARLDLGLVVADGGRDGLRKELTHLVRGTKDGVVAGDLVGGAGVGREGKERKSLRREPC
mgnify:CR=1 FL=1